ncbi:MAG: RDD family protein [Solirubrobacterales bacterium]
MNETDVVYVGFWRRLLASFIDNVTWLCFYAFYYVYLVAVVGVFSEVAAVFVVLAFFSLWFNYFLFCEWRWGQTIGKNATGIEVRSLDGSERLSFGQASVRNVLRIVDFFVIGWVMVAVGKRKQRLGDKAAKTVVVRRPPRTMPALQGAAEPRGRP